MTDILAANATEAALLSRRSIRGFLPTPVPRGDVAHLLDVRARAVRHQHAAVAAGGTGR